MLIDAHGLVVNVSSAADRIPFPFRGAYGMTKAAVSSFSRTLEVELYHFNVRVLNVVSTMVKSNLAQNASARLPPDSLWSNMAEHMDPVPEDTKMESKDWAQKTVFEALRGEGYHVGPFRLSGTKSEFWVGSNSGPTRALWCLGSGWLRWVALILWPLGRVKSPEK